MNIIKDPIDDILKVDAASNRDAYIDDAGFTMRVIDNLSTGAQVTSAKMRFTIPFVFTLLAATFVALFTGAGNFLVDAAMDIATSSMTKSAVTFIAIIVIVVAVSATAANDN